MGIVGFVCVTCRLRNLTLIQQPRPKKGKARKYKTESWTKEMWEKNWFGARRDVE
jgi:hypothetical protein